MILDAFDSPVGAWLTVTEPAGGSDTIVVSSRVRLARNIANFPFMSKASAAQKQELCSLFEQRVAKLGMANLNFMMLDTASAHDRQLLLERHLISKNLAAGEGARGVAVSRDETLSIMVNEEDHIRLQVLRSGLKLQECWAQADQIDNDLQQHLEFAFNHRFGYLTACPTNVGTGLRVSVMLHLPALKLNGDMDKVFAAAKDMHLAIRGLYGEGTEAVGDFYQLSNQTTLGRSEEEIIHELESAVLPQVLYMEQDARQRLLTQRPYLLDDRIGRALGVLKYARVLSTEETLFHLSYLRLGTAMGRISGVSMALLNRLFLWTQSAHLQVEAARDLDPEARKVHRADVLRKYLNL